MLRPQHARPRLLDGRGQIINLAEQLRLDQLQLRPDPPVVDGRRRPRGPRGHRRGRPPQPRAARRPRQRAGPGLQPHDPAPGRRARQADAGALGHRRLPPPLRPRARGDVAGRDGRRHRLARGAGRGGIRFTILAPAPGEALAAARRRGVGRDPGRDRPVAGLPVPAPLGPVDRAVLLRRHRLAAGRLRAAPGQRRAVPRAGCSRASTTRREHAQLMHIATDGESYGHHHPHGDMALAYVLDRLASDPDDPPDQLRRVPGAAPARVGGRDPREQLLELRPRRRALAVRLRLQDPRRLAPEMARPAAQGARPAQGAARPPVRAPAAASASPTPGRPATPTSR